MIIYGSSPTVTEGATLKSVVTDTNNEQLLGEVLDELKKMNIHMSLVTDEIIETEDVED